VTNLEKARIWKNVTSKINALGVAPRSVKEIKDKWRNLTSKAKSAFTEYRRDVKHCLHTFLFIYEACRLKTPFDASEA
jgi:hypothetical protein